MKRFIFHIPGMFTRVCAVYAETEAEARTRLGQEGCEELITTLDGTTASGGTELVSIQDMSNNKGEKNGKEKI